VTWLDLAACAGHPVNNWFDDRHTDQAITICRTCPVQTDCLTYAFHHREFEFGVYGGLTPRERRREWRNRGRRYRPAAA
jgi:hypothetical protein